MKVHRLPVSELSHVVSSVDGISEGRQDEMAIPSYLHGNPLIRRLMWRRLDCIAEFLRTGNCASVLEFGCGIGVFLPTLCKLSRTVYAIDLVSAYARALAANYGLDVTFVEDLRDVPAQSLDVIIAADVLEHIEDVPSCLAAFREKLSDGGRLIVSGPTENIVYKIGREIAGFGKKGDYHKSNIDDLKAVIVSCGFRIARSTTLPFAILPSDSSWGI